MDADTSATGRQDHAPACCNVRVEDQPVTMDDLLNVAPASSHVLRDLISLRSRQGITMRKVKEQCPHLQQLTAVRLELARRRLAPSDLHVAAHEVVCCAVRGGERVGTCHASRREARFVRGDWDRNRREADVYFQSWELPVS